jgi:hypothetical protein
MELQGFVVAVCALSLVAAGCSRPLPPDVAPNVASHRAEPTFKRKPAPEVQPEPAHPLVRDLRAEGLLARIGEGEAQIALANARAKSNGAPVACSNETLQQVEVLERKALARRNDLREAAFEEPAEQEAVFADLTKLATQAGELADRCGGTRPALYAAQRDSRLVRDASGGTEIQLTGPLAGAPAVRRMSVGATIRGAFQDLFRTKGEYRIPASNGLALAAQPSGPPPAPPPVAPPLGSAAAHAPAHDASMLLRSAQLVLAVFEVDKKMEAVMTIATEVGGYLALRGDRELTVRVPRERFDEALRRMEGVGDVLHRSVAAEDVTDQYVDLELRLKNAQAVRARLEKLLETATVKDAVEIHKELAKVTEEIERLSGKLKLLKDRIAFSTITVTFERTEPQRIKSQALLPFTWMRTMGLGPLLQVSR